MFICSSEPWEDPLEEDMATYLPRKFHEQRSQAGYSPWGHKRIRHNLATSKTTIYAKDSIRNGFYFIIIHSISEWWWATHGNRRPWQSCAGKTKMRLNGDGPTWTTRKDTFHTISWDYTQELNQDKGALLIIKPCPPPGDLPNTGTEPRSPALQAYSLPSEAPGKPQ